MDLDASVPTDMALYHYFLHGQIPEPEVVWLMAKVVREGDLVVDGGANVGFFALLLSTLVGPSGRVIAVEPSERNRKKLLRNIELNNRQNVTVIPEALSFNSKPVEFYQHQDNGQDACHGSGEPQTIPATTLDAIVGDKKPRLIKLDIEGAEVSALCGAVNLLDDRTADFIVCETNSEAMAAMGTDIEELVNVLYDYEPFIMSADGSIPAIVPDGCTLVPQRPNSNLLFSSVEDVAAAWQEVKY